MKMRQPQPSRLSATTSADQPKSPYPFPSTAPSQRIRRKEPGTAPGARRSAAATATTAAVEPGLELHHPRPKRPAIRNALENFERKSEELETRMGAGMGPRSSTSHSPFSPASPSSSAQTAGSASRSGSGTGSWLSDRSRGKVRRTVDAVRRRVGRLTERWRRD
ncbi:uncharacterized protein BKA78DRAFT_134636 [Phyllosticta capitalensis]|uniref:uncharacterized protein n=1 Tax=Phyllosticta capitalensis TaxID=121624 RepID=UPI0031300B61